MLPPGHIAAGYLTAKVLIGSLHYDLTAGQINDLTIIAALLAFIPDLDFFAAFAKIGKFRMETGKTNHRHYPSHAPIVWLILGLIIFVFSASAFGKTLGLLVWLAPWSHFILDSQWGIMWLWPFSKKLYPFSESFYKRLYAQERPKSDNFWKYWLRIAAEEYKSASGIIEIVIIIIALATFIKFR